jgi:hypothetical protein
VALLKALDIGEGQGIDEIDLTSAQGRQAHRVLALGFADDLVEIGQMIALGIRLPVVLEAHHTGLIEALPRDELERPGADGMLRGPGKVIWGLQVGRVVQHTGWHGDIRLIQVETHRVFVDDLGPLNSFYRPAVPIAANGGVFDMLDVELHRFRIDLTAIVKQHAFA